METLTEYAERMWRGEATMRGLFADGAPMGVAAPVADGVAVVPGFANVIAFQTADGLVLVDTGLHQTAQAMFDAVRAWSADPVRYAVFTHGHVDHVFGVAPYDREAAAKGWQVPVVVAHEAVAARFGRYVRTAGYNAVINRRQFGLDELEWPVDYRYPEPRLPRPGQFQLRWPDVRVAARARRDRRPHLGVRPRTPGAVPRRPVRVGIP